MFKEIFPPGIQTYGKIDKEQWHLETTVIYLIDFLIARINSSSIYLHTAADKIPYAWINHDI